MSAVAEAFDAVGYINTPRWQASRLGLERTVDLLNRMGRPQDRLRFVHVAGTNGKGSTCAYLDSILRCAGYRVGLFTSPYIETFEERIRVNGENISAEDLKEVTLFVKQHAEAIEAETGDHPTEFELMTAVAFEHFARSACDIVVLEVGLGGRLDSTNVIDSPEVCVIARIGLDHTALLGNTLAGVAAEKAGILKPGASVVSWPQEPEAQASIEKAAVDKRCELCVPDFSQLALKACEGERASLRTFVYKGQSFKTKLLASYQPYNAALALEAAALLRARGWEISAEAMSEGLACAVWPGRFEVVAQRPLTIVDGGHNPQGAAVLAKSLDDVFCGRKAVFVMGVLADKDYAPMVRAVLSHAQAFYVYTPPNPRALFAADLAKCVEEESFGAISAVVCSSPAHAMNAAREQAGEDGLVVAFGSLYAIADLKSALV